jgi:hypothetical protein
MTDIAGWVIALVGSRSLVGKPSRSLNEEPVTTSPATLSPVYELAILTTGTNKGPASIRSIRPILMFPDIVEIALPAGVSVVAIDKMSRASQVDLSRGVSSAEDLCASLRSGVVTAG